ncbi:type I DNA topoisomerase [Candidatus Parcubacteria bacterium]|nr:type I DNA topoisomerase [Candidatus Parcubacteria bacterium]
MDLIIVESPTKARTISKFLPSKYKVVSCFGHIRDLPKSKLGVDVEKNFEPQYLIPNKAKKTVKDLKEKSKKANQVILASDEDREGEAIAWHLIQALKLKKGQIQRIVFHEITKIAIEKALANPREINIDMVDAQQARRVLDRLVGYELSPFLWKKIRYGLSAGRVQSVATRLIVEREREIQKFEEDEYWSIISEVRSQKSDIGNNKFKANLVKIDGKTLGKLDIGNSRQAEKIKSELEKANYQIEKITKKEKIKNPLPPFTTSTLQQAANNRLGYSAKQTMMLAQQLYEGIDYGKKDSGGLITYMRTDSLNLSADSLKSAKSYIIEKFGKEYSEQRVFKTKSKGAQEAHEAIRPTDPSLDPESAEQYLNDKQFKLYQLIWQRMVASQMASAVSDSTIIDISAGEKYGLRMNGSVINFFGFLKVYPIKSEDVTLPELEEKEKLDLLSVNSEQHFTQPPARYNDASLVKILEKHGIGRPSTYAPTISTIIARGYVEREGRNLKPKDVAFIVIDLLVKHFSKIVDYEFTAQMEDNLDEVAYGKVKWQPMIKSFYKPFKNNLMQKEQEVNKKDLGVEQSTDKKCDKCGSPMIIKLGRFGKFLACGNYPECKNTKPINEKGEIEEPEKVDVKCDKCGKPMVVKNGRYGKFLGCSGYPDCKNIKPIVKSTGVKCPQCGKGEIVEKKSKRGKTFYACDQYPDCKNAYWSKPTGDKCPKCGSLMVFVKGGESACSNKDCR